jgi:hypothetical protein
VKMHAGQVKSLEPEVLAYHNMNVTDPVYAVRRNGLAARAAGAFRKVRGSARPFVHLQLPSAAAGTNSMPICVAHGRRSLRA